MLVKTIQQRLREAREKTGGRYGFTIYEDGTEGHEAHCTHWYRPSPFAFEDCRAVAVGSVPDCLDALDHYVTVYQHGPRPMVDADLGLLPVANTQPLAAE